MLDIKFIRDNPEKVEEGIAKKGVKVEIDKLLSFDKQRRELIKKIDELRSKKNVLSGRSEEAVKVKSEIQDLEAELKIIEEKFSELMYQVPNLPLDDAPVGKNEKDNVILREVGKKPEFSFTPKDYLELATELDLIDVERAAKVSGSRFGYLKREAALLEFALIQLAFDTLVKEGFIPIVPPVMIKPEMMKAMGYINKISNGKFLISNGDKSREEEIYFLRDDDLVLVGTSEQAVGPMHADETFDEKDLPRRYAAFSTCFRREAGSYGKDTKGILRVHQFDKVEMFSFTKSEDSYKEHKFLLSLQEKLMQELKLPYQVVQICTSELGDPAAAKYDIEAWLPGQGQYRETHSTSNTTDFQARRLNIKYRKKGGKTEFVHMLNGTAFAIGRMIIAILENYQQKDGSIKIPKVLQKHTGFEVIK